MAEPVASSNAVDGSSEPKKKSEFSNGPEQLKTRWEKRKERKRAEKQAKYNKPHRTAVPAKPSRPAHKIVQFWRRSATVVVHVINARGHWVQTDTVYHWLVPYENVGYLKPTTGKNRIKFSDATHAIHNYPMPQRLGSAKTEAKTPEVEEEPEESEEESEEEVDNNEDADVKKEDDDDSSENCDEGVRSTPSPPPHDPKSEYGTSQRNRGEKPDKDGYHIHSRTLHVHKKPGGEEEEEERDGKESTSEKAKTNPTDQKTEQERSLPAGDFSTQDLAQVQQLQAAAESAPQAESTSSSSRHKKNPEARDTIHSTPEVEVSPSNPDKVSEHHATKTIDPYDTPLPPVQLHPNFLIIDARRPDEYKESHIHGAINVHYTPPRLMSKTKRKVKLPNWVTKDTLIITYCAVGLRSGLLALYLRKQGYVFVRILSGGYYKWVNEERPIYRDPEELVNKVIIQHSIAGIMLREDAKLKLSRKERKQRKKQIKKNKKGVKNNYCHQRTGCELPDE